MTKGAPRRKRSSGMLDAETISRLFSLKSDRVVVPVINSRHPWGHEFLKSSSTAKPQERTLISSVMLWKMVKNQFTNFFWRVTYSPGRPWTGYVDKDDFEFLIHLPPLVGYVALEIKCRQKSTEWAPPPALHPRIRKGKSRERSSYSALPFLAVRKIRRESLRIFFSL